MDAKSNFLVPIRNERGYFIIANSQGGSVPFELSDQIWLSEKEADLAVIKYLSETVVTKESKEV